MAQCSIDIRLKRTSKEFAEGVRTLEYIFIIRIKNFNFQFYKYKKDIIAGDIIINSSTPAVHSGIYLTLDGMVNINLSTKNVGVFEAFYNSAKVIRIKKSIAKFHSGLHVFECLSRPSP